MSKITKPTKSKGKATHKAGKAPASRPSPRKAPGGAKPDPVAIDPADPDLVASDNPKDHAEAVREGLTTPFCESADLTSARRNALSVARQVVDMKRRIGGLEEEAKATRAELVRATEAAVARGERVSAATVAACEGKAKAAEEAAAALFVETGATEAALMKSLESILASEKAEIEKWEPTWFELQERVEADLAKLREEFQTAQAALVERLENMGPEPIAPLQAGAWGKRLVDRLVVDQPGVDAQQDTDPELARLRGFALAANLRCVKTGTPAQVQRVPIPPKSRGGNPGAPTSRIEYSCSACGVQATGTRLHFGQETPGLARGNGSWLR